MVQMMNVMIADVGGEPCHQRACAHITGGIQCGLLESPSGVVVEGNPREIMLGVKQIGPNRGGDEVRNDLYENQRHPATEPEQRARDGKVDDQGHEAIQMPLGIIVERIETHSEQKHEHITEQDGERMPDEKIATAFPRRRFDKLLLGHDGIRANLRSAQF